MVYLPEVVSSHKFFFPIKYYEKPKRERIFFKDRKRMFHI